MKKFRDFIYNQHDVVCNQKYANVLPYSFHLGSVEAQFNKFERLLPCDLAINNNTNDTFFRAACIAHDAIEDARLTHADIVEAVRKYLGGSFTDCLMVADIVFCVTDEKGKIRGERKNDKYYAELKKNKYAIFIKLADLAANTLFSKLTGSSMYDKYKKEWPDFKEKLYVEEYEEFFNYVENL